MPTPEDLTPSERVTVANGLRVAALQYDKLADTLRAMAKETPIVLERLIGQFVHQAKEARALADKFEN